MSLPEIAATTAAQSFHVVLLVIILIGALVSVTDESENPFLLTPFLNDSQTLAWLHADLDLKWRNLPTDQCNLVQSMWYYVGFIFTAVFTILDAILRRLVGFQIPMEKPRNFVKPPELEIKWSIRMYVLYGYLCLFLKGICKEIFWACLRKLGILPPPRKSVLHSDNFHFLYLEHAYKPIEDCWNRPIDSAADSTIDVCMRARDTPFGILGPLYMTQEKRRCVNLGSYNYLGFGGFDDECTPAVHQAIDDYGIATCSSRAQAGTLSIHEKLEHVVAKFLSKEAAITVGMGYAANSTILPALLGTQAKNILVISDQLNHRSIVEGVRLTGASVKSFLHNDMDDLERLLREGCERKKAMLIVVEGIYSMEGEFCRLREIVALKKRYGAMIYLDEAHSIGAVGPTGRGVCDLLGVPTSDIEIMMGTFTKSFGSVGGYVASTHKIIARLRSTAGFIHASAMSAPATQQALSAFEIIMGPDGKGTEKGKKKLRQVVENANFMRTELRKMGCKVLGDVDSPVIPVMLFHNWKIPDFSRECLDKDLAVVVVGYPATPVLTSRVRICVSASHTKEIMIESLDKIREVVKSVGINYEGAGDGSLSPEEAEYRKLLREAPLNLGRSDVALQSMKYIESLPVVTYPVASDLPIKADLRSWDVLGMSRDPPAFVRKACHDAVTKYGCGTCGPRGFYGGTIWHLQVETELSKFLDVEAAIVYSNHISTTSSVIPAFVTAKDILFVDREVSYGALAGIRLCKAEVRFFKHNDMEDLEQQLADHSKKQFIGQRYIISEGIFMKSGQVCPLPRLLDLRTKYNAWLMIDETLSFGVLGSGRGVAPHFGREVRDIDFIIGSLEHALGSVGGFCAGREEIVWRQRLAGAGYCFSAAAPTYAMASTTEVFRAFPHERVRALEEKCSALRHLLKIGGAGPLVHLDGGHRLRDRLAQEGVNTEISFYSPLDCTIWSRMGMTNAPPKQTVHFFVTYDTDVNFVANAIKRSMAKA